MVKALTWLIAFAGALHPVVVGAQIEVRVSIKLLYNNTVTNNGVWTPIPPGGDVNNDGILDPNHCTSLVASAISCDEEIYEKFNYVNMLMDRFGRGYRFNLIEIVHLTNPPAPPLSVGTNCWTLASPGGETENALTTAILANKTAYAFRDSALNGYVFNADGGGYSDNILTTATNKLFTTSQGMRGSWPRFLHEIGHNLGLYHTFGSGSGTNQIPSDSVCDTVQSASSFRTLEEVAQLNFGTNFLSLNCQQQQLVFDNFYNVMSYQADDDHTDDCRLFNPDEVVCGNASTAGYCRHRLTVDQLDRISNRLNNLATVAIVSGRTVFVSRTYNPCDSIPNSTTNDCPCDQAPRDIAGNPVAPYSTIAEGLISTATDPNHDVLLVRAGNYAETLTINQKVTLRATRGTVRIGQ
jgi:hypothetical protein